MAVLVADITSRAKEFATLGSPEIQAAIDDAELQINTTVWGTKADLATIYLAAHNLSIQNPTLATSSGAVQSETVGEVSRTYAVSSSGSGAGMKSTRWGQEYLRLMRQLPSVTVS